jgi:cysteine-rich repeat protein
MTDDGCAGKLYQVMGGSALTDSWEGSNISTSEVGSISILFTDDDHGTMNLTIGGTSVSKVIERQVFSTLSPGAAMTALWWNAAESGWGATLTQQTNVVFVTIFTYDTNGFPTWYVASNCKVSGITCTGELYEVVGGTALTDPWDGSNKVVTKVGEVTATFDDDDNGTLAYTIDGVAGSKIITRQIWATDADRDGINDANDNCLSRSNADQKDDDNDGEGNACEIQIYERVVIAAEGATISLLGGASLEIPGGALAEDTTITISVPPDQGPTNQIHRFLFEPAELLFTEPVLLTVPYDVKVSTDPAITAWQFSPLIEEKDLGSEKVSGDVMEVVSHDQENGLITLSLDHFTYVALLIGVQEYVYVVKHLPIQFIDKGNILFTLTDFYENDRPNWLTGHVALAALDTDVCTRDLTSINNNATKHIIESSGSVKTTSLSELKTEFNHVYMGARRLARSISPGGVASIPQVGVDNQLSDAERDAVVQFATNNLGASYSPIGISVTDDAFSCVSLVESAYDTIGRGTLNTFQEHLISTPLEMFVKTVPQDDIQVKVGELVEFEVHGVVIHPESPYTLTRLRGWYCHDYPCRTDDTFSAIDITMDISSGMPEAATFTREENGVYKFSWQPSASDVNTETNLTFALTTEPFVSDPLDGLHSLGTKVKEAFANIEVVSCQECGDEILDAGEDCDDGNTIDGDGCDSTCKEEVTQSDMYSIDPFFIAATHVYDETECPQILGTIHLTNTDTGVHSYDISIDDPNIVVAVSTITSAPGETVLIDLYFLCDVAGSDSTLTIQGTREDGSPLDTTTVSVKVVVEGAPAS